MKWRSSLQGTALFLILGVALSADGLMDSLGPARFSLVAGVVLAIAGLFLWLSGKPVKGKRSTGGNQ